VHAEAAVFEKSPGAQLCALTNPVQFQLRGSTLASLVLLVLLFSVMLYFVNNADTFAAATLQLRVGMVSSCA
jgi:hypothetical protein